jgi:hypothetical protein
MTQNWGKKSSSVNPRSLNCSRAPSIDRGDRRSNAVSSVDFRIRHFWRRISEILPGGARSIAVAIQDSGQLAKLAFKIGALAFVPFLKIQIGTQA